MQVPLAATTLQPAHAEVAGTLTVLHLPEQRLDGGAAAAVAIPPVPGAQLAVHPLTRGHGVRLASPRRRRIAQGGALLVILLRSDDQLALRALAGSVSLGPVAGIRHRGPQHDPALVGHSG